MAAGPTSENQSPRRWPPVTKTSMSLRLLSSMATLTVLVMTVMLRSCRLRTTSVVVVPAVSAMRVAGLQQLGRGLGYAALLLGEPSYLVLKGGLAEWLVKERLDGVAPPCVRRSSPRSSSSCRSRRTSPATRCSARRGLSMETEPPCCRWGEDGLDASRLAFGAVGHVESNYYSKTKARADQPSRCEARCSKRKRG